MVGQSLIPFSKLNREAEKDIIGWLKANYIITYHLVQQHTWHCVRSGKPDTNYSQTSYAIDVRYQNTSIKLLKLAVSCLATN